MKTKNNFKLKLLAASVAVFAGNLHAAEPVENENEETEVIEVTGIRDSIVRSTELKRSASSVVDVITAEDVGKFPDDNVMDSLNRITGVQINRDETGTASAFQIRGISQNRVELNGRSVAGGEGEGRNMNLGDIPSELIAGLEVIKSPMADMIEGSLGATVNLKTARPLSKRDNLTSLTAKAKYGDNIEKWYGNYHALTSHKWDLGEYGKFGVLISGTFNDNKVAGDVIKVNGWPNNDQGACGLYNINSAGTAVNQANWLCEQRTFGPGSYTMLQFENNNERSSLTTTLQWRPSANSEYIFDINYNKKVDESSRDTLNMSMRAGNNFLNVDYVTDRLNEDNVYEAYSNVKTTPYEVAISNYFLDDATTYYVNPVTSLSTDSAILSNTNSQGNHLVTERITLGLSGKWTLEDWKLSAEAGYTESDHERHYLAAGLTKYQGNPFDLRNQVLFVDDGEARRLEGSHVDLDLTDPRLVSLNWTELNGDPIDLLDPTQYRMSGMQDDGWIHKPREFSFRADADYFLDYGHLTTLEFGVRATQNIMERTERFRFNCSRNYSYNATGPNDSSYDPDTDLACEDPSVSAVDLITDYPEFFQEVDGYFSKEDTFQIGNWLQMDNRAFFDNPELWAEVTGFADEGYEIDPSEYYKLTENTAAAYIKANLEGEVSSDIYYKANFGVRAVYTDVESLVTPGSDELNAREAKDSFDYLEFLPSMNVAFTLMDDYIVRLAAAKVMVRPNFDQIKPTGSFNQFTGCQVYDDTGYTGPWPNESASGAVQDLQTAQAQYLNSGQHTSTMPCPGIRPLNGNNVGNLQLDPYTSYNYDLSLETYWGEGNSASVALFYRDVQADIVRRNDIFEVPVDPADQAVGLSSDGDDYDYELRHSYEGENISVIEGVELWRVKQYENGGTSTRYGVELSYTQFLDFLPKPLSNFGVGLNYTYSDGERPDPVYIYGDAHELDGQVIDLNSAELAGYDLSSHQSIMDALREVVGTAGTQFDLQDQESLMPINDMSKHSGNASVFYDDKTINARISYNYRSERYTSLMGNGLALYRDADERVDFSSGYRYSPKVRFTFNIQNLLRSYDHRYIIDPSITAQTGYTDRTYTLGVNVKF